MTRALVAPNCFGLRPIGLDEIAGRLYDCDFNQMLEIDPPSGARTIWDLEDLAELKGAIATASHCFGCTAGAGSSCGGSLA